MKRVLLPSLFSSLAPIAIVEPMRQASAAEPPRTPPGAAGTQVKPAATQPTGIVIVPTLEEPKNARKLEEKDFAAYFLLYFKDQTQSACMAISRDGYTFTDVNGGRSIFDGALLAEIAAHVVPERPGRLEPRHLIRERKHYPALRRQTRAQWRIRHAA